MLAKVAQEMAACWYEEAAHDNDFFHFYPSQNKFVKREWHRFLPAAKAQLSTMLGLPETQVPEWQKEQIFDALIKHASLPGNTDRNTARQVVKMNDNIVRVH